MDILKIKEYINNLNIIDNSIEDITLSQLLLLDVDLFSQVFDSLSSNKISLNDIIKLDTINNKTIKEFLDSKKDPSGNIISIRNTLVSNQERNVSLSNFKNRYLAPDFKNYIYRKFNDGNSYFVNVDNQYANMTAESSLKKYNSIVEDYLKFINSNSSIKAKRNEFKLFHDNFRYANNYIFNLVELPFIDPIFINSVFNKRKFTSIKSYNILLSQVYRYNSPSTFDILYNELLDAMVDNFNNDSSKVGWDTIEALGIKNDWHLDAHSDDIFKQFQKTRLLRYFYPMAYSRYNKTFDVSNEKDTINDFIKYFNLASDLLLEIIKLSKIKFELKV